MKLDQLFNLQSFSDAKSRKLDFADSYAGSVLSRHLISLDPKVLERKYPALVFVNSGIQADNSGGYAQAIQTLKVSEQGGYRNSSDQGDNKGVITLTGEQKMIPVIGREATSVWTETEVKQAEMGNFNLVAKHIEAHNKVYQQEIDEIGLVGKGTQKGLLNTTEFGAIGSAGSKIENLTGVQMYDLLAGLIQDQWNGVNNTVEYMADTMVLPPRALNAISGKLLKEEAGSDTVLTALQKNYATVKILASFRAEGDGSASRAVVFSTNEDAMKMRLPVPLQIGEIVKQGSFNYKFDSMYRIGGLDILESSAGKIIKGV